MIEKTKIVFTIPSLKGGGAEKVTSLLANGLDKSTYEVHLVVFDGEDRLYEIDEKGVLLHDFEVKRIRSGFLKMLKFLKSEKPNIVFSSMVHLNLLISLVRLFYWSNTKFIARESTMLSYTAGQKKSLLNTEWIIKFFYRKFHLVICQCQDMKTDLMKLLSFDGKNFKVINNPVKKSIYKKEEVTNVPIKLVTIGSMRPEKGYDRMFTILNQLEEDFEYSLIGDDALGKDLVNKISESKALKKTIFYGKQKDPLKIASQCDIYLQTSYFEGFPNALLEALTCGIPAVVYNCPGGTREIIKHGFNGFLVPDGDLKSFVEHLQKAKNHTWDTDAIIEDINHRFGINKIINEYDDLFTKVAQN